MVTISPTHAGKIYKWVDENGVSQFSTYPPLNQQSDRKVTTLRLDSGATNPSKFSCDRLCGVWIHITHKKVNRLTITKDGFNYQPEDKNATWKEAKGGEWKLDGDTLEVSYSKHQVKSKIGGKENFFVKMPTPETLILIPSNDGKRVIFQQEHNFSKPEGGRSGIEQEFIGTWKSIRGMDGDSITFTNKKFTVYGRITKGGGERAYEITDTKYQGLWHVEDPYITLQITIDNVYKSIDKYSLVGSAWRWIILSKTDALLTARDTATRRTLKFVKASN